MPVQLLSPASAPPSAETTAAEAATSDSNVPCCSQQQRQLQSSLLPQQWLPIQHSSFTPSSSTCLSDTSARGLRKVLFASGNIVKSRSYYAGDSRQTLLEAIDASLQSGDAGWLPPASGDDGRTVAPIGTHTPLSPNELEERNDLEVGVKIFLAEKPEAAREACRTVSAFLDARQIDSLVINVSPSLTPSYDEIWDALADCVKCGLVKSLGVAGVSGEELTAFTRRAALKPALVEVSSEDLDFAALQELASEHRFTVRLSQDPAAGPLPSKAVEALTEKHAVALSPDWIARYVVFHNARGVILHVGYLCGLNLTSS